LIIRAGASLYFSAHNCAEVLHLIERNERRYVRQQVVLHEQKAKEERDNEDLHLLICKNNVWIRQSAHLDDDTQKFADKSCQTCIEIDCRDPRIVVSL
jgi:hypothetical protein